MTQHEQTKKEIISLIINKKTMSKWNFSVDLWFEQVDVFWESTMTSDASYLQDIQNVVQPTSNIPEKVDQEIDLASFGLHNMEEYQLMVDIKEDWGSLQDFNEILTQLRSDKQVKSEVETEKDSWFLSAAWDVAETVIDVAEAPWRIAWAAIAQAPAMVWNIWGFFLWKPVDFLLKSVGLDVNSLEEQFKKDWIESKEKLQEVLWVDPEDFTTKMWEFWAEVWSLFIPWGQAKLAAKFPQAISKIASLGSSITKLWEKAPRTFNTLKNALVWAKEFWKFEIVSEWEVTPEGLAIWAVANPLIGTTIRGIWKISKVVAEKLELAWLLNPAKLDKVAKQLRTDWVEEASSVADFLLKKNIKGNKEAIVKTLQSDARWSKKVVDEALKADTTTKFSQSADEALDVLRKQTSDVPWLKKEFNRFRELAFKNKKWEWLTQTEKNEVKRGLDDFINIFKDTWEIIAWTNKVWASNIRKALQGSIEKQAKNKNSLDILEKAGFENLKAANKNTQVSFTLAEAIARKDASDQASALINAFAPSWAGAIIGWVGAEWNVFDRLKGALIGATIGRVVWSTTVKTNVANILNKLSGLEKVALEEFVRTKGQKELSPKIVEKITWAKGFNKVGATKSAEVSTLKQAIKDAPERTIGYHWTNKEFDQFLDTMIWKWATAKFWDGVYLSSSPQVAKTYGDLMSWLKGGKSRLLEVAIPDNFNIKAYDWPITGLKKASDEARKAGFKWIKYNAWDDFIKIPWRKVDTAGQSNYIIFNPADAKIIKNNVVNELWAVKGLWLMRDLLAWSIVWLSGIQIWLEIKNFLEKSKEPELFQATLTPRW